MALCDDIIDYNKKMESYIEKYGNENHVEVKITSYGSGSQLLLNYQKRKFDVIFLDVSMPEMDLKQQRRFGRVILMFQSFFVLLIIQSLMQGKALKLRQKIFYQNLYCIEKLRIS